MSRCSTNKKVAARLTVASNRKRSRNGISHAMREGKNGTPANDNCSEVYAMRSWPDVVWIVTGVSSRIIIRPGKWMRSRDSPINLIVDRVNASAVSDRLEACWSDRSLAFHGWPIFSFFFFFFFFFFFALTKSTVSHGLFRETLHFRVNFWNWFSWWKYRC